MNAPDESAPATLDHAAPRAVEIPGWPWIREVPFVQAVVAGSLVLTCGIAPFDEQGRVVGVGDVEAQVRQVFANLEVVLRAAGSDWKHVLRLQTYLTNREHLPIFKAVRRELYETPYPASLLVVVSALADAEMLVEVMCDAVCIDPGGQST
jgi:enamine deaminase RidA (YjgF/YER057c/UK114 family)